jgi:hypothetical protein
MSVNGFFSRYWRHLLLSICGCAVIAGLACKSGGGGSNSPLLIITSVGSSSLTAGGATITWNTNRPADSLVEYGLNTGYGNSMSVKTMQTSHSLTLIGLTPDTTYNYRVKSTDASGNLSTSGNMTFTTAKSGSPNPTPTPNPIPVPTPFPVGGVDEFVGPFDSWKRVTAYGANGNDTNDDTAAIQQALEDMSSDGPVKTLYFPAGTYRISSTLKLHNSIFVNLIGEDPDRTIISWATSNPGTMILIDGVASSRFNRLTWDGQNVAEVAVDQSKAKDGANYFDTGNQYAEDVFKNVGIGIRGGYRDEGASETSVVRCRFLNNSKAGIATENFNALDWWIWYSYFENCARGVTNTLPSQFSSKGAGNFNVYYSVFKGSTVADLSIINTQFNSFRNNYSIGSRRFFDAADAGQNGALTVIQGNTILDTTDPISIYIGHYGPIQIYDNFIRSKAGSPGPAIRISAPADTLAFGNTFTISNQISQAGGRFVPGGSGHSNSIGTINASEPVIPFKYVPVAGRKVFEVPVGATTAAIQQAINSAGAFCGQRPIVHLQQGEHKVAQTLVVPPNCDIQIVGDGAASSLLWNGAQNNQPVLTLRGPSKAILRDFRVRGEERAEGILIENADQPNSRIYMQEASAAGTFAASQNGLLVDGLDNARVDLRGFLHSAFMGSSVKVVGGPSGSGGASRTVMISGAASNNTVSYEVANGGHLVVKDFWYEVNVNNSMPRYIKLTGDSVATFEQMLVATTANNADAPAIDIQNFNGKVALIALDLALDKNTDPTQAVRITGTGAGSVLGLGLFGRSSNFLSNPGAVTKAALINSRYRDGSVATTKVDDLGSLDSNLLTQTRNILQGNISNEYEVFPAAITDVRMYRVYVEKATIAFHIKR